jgi:hypothetical protein
MKFISKARTALLCVLLAAVGTAQPQTTSTASMDLQAMVRQASANAAAGAQDMSKLFSYRALKETNSGTALREMIETQDVILARTLTWNGRQLTAEERAKEDAKLDLLVRSPEELRKKQADQASDRKRTLQVVKALPDALIFRFDGMERINGREAYRLKFTPNPNFDPTTKETYGLKAAAGTLWIDKEQTQIVKMDATLTENVYIGWGILGHINKGGRLELEQTLLPGKAWRISKLNIDATGKAFFFKTIRIKNRQSGWDYRPVPTNLTIAQAVEALKKPEGSGAPQRAATP